MDEYLGDMEDAPTHAHICVHAHAHMCACTCCCAKNIHVQKSQLAAFMGIMFISMFNMCVCVHACGASPCPQLPSPICPIPQSQWGPKLLKCNKYLNKLR